MPVGLAMRPACAAPAQADAGDAANICTGAVSIAGVRASLISPVHLRVTAQIRAVQTARFIDPASPARRGVTMQCAHTSLAKRPGEARGGVLGEG